MKKFWIAFMGILCLSWTSAQSTSGIGNVETTKTLLQIESIKNEIHKTQVALNTEIENYQKLVGQDDELRRDAKAAVHDANAAKVDVGSARSAKKAARIAKKAAKANKVLEKNFKTEKKMFRNIEKLQKKQAKDYKKLNEMETANELPLTPIPEPLKVVSPERITN